MTIPHPQQLLDFSGKVVVVTGSGSGLGSGIAKRFAQAGAKVVINYRTSKIGANTVVRDIEADEGEAVSIQADVTKKDGAETLIEKIVQTFDRLDVLVNNAGIYPLTTLLDMTETDWDAVLDANLRSVFLCTQLAAKQMIAQGQGGAIINIASIEGENPAPMHSHYNAAKGGVLMHTMAAANELGSHGIRVNAVSPGLIWREGLDEAWPDGVERWQKAAPLTRLGMAEDVADACLFLASSGARWITGANLRVDGGVMTHQIF
ncbi:MAG: glucose 1-dehydrogenase [Chloroflexota bacterium]